jgi:hypothetical protein
MRSLRKNPSKQPKPVTLGHPGDAKQASLAEEQAKARRR